MAEMLKEERNDLVEVRPSPGDRQVEGKDGIQGEMKGVA